MSDKLVKEIITTTTERFGDNGSIKEKVTESREKIYHYGYTEKQLAEAEVVEPGEKKDEAPAKPKEKTKEELIQEAAKSIDSKAVKKSEASVPIAQTTAPVSPYDTYLNQQQGSQTKFPWEQAK